MELDRANEEHLDGKEWLNCNYVDDGFVGWFKEAADDDCCRRAGSCLKRLNK